MLSVAEFDLKYQFIQADFDCLDYIKFDDEIKYRNCVNLHLNPRILTAHFN